MLLCGNLLKLVRITPDFDFLGAEVCGSPGVHENMVVPGSRDRRLKYGDLNLEIDLSVTFLRLDILELGAVGADRPGWRQPTGKRKRRM